MKIIGSVVVLSLSLSALSAFYTGAGDWKSKSDSGSYLVSANIEHNSDNNTITISQTLTFSEKVLNFSVLLQKLDENFYEVKNDQGETVGDGYCWPIEEENSIICHTVTHEQGHVTESTIKKTEHAIYRIGSKIDLENSEKIIWKDELILQNNG